MHVVNELTSSTLNLKFVNDVGTAVVPSHGKYKITDDMSGEIITDWVEFIPTTNSYDIAVTGIENVITDPSRESETHSITTIVYYSGDKQCTALYQYEVKNLNVIPPVMLVVCTESGTAAETPSAA